MLPPIRPRPMTPICMPVRLPSCVGSRTRAGSPGLFHLDDVGHPDLLVQYRLQDDEAARGIVVVEGYGFAHDVDERHLLDGVLDALAVGALTVGDRLGDDADGVVA